MSPEQGIRGDEYVARIRAIARDCGHALGVHGSQARDLDLIAVPWAVEAVSAQHLVDTIKDAMGLVDAPVQPGLAHVPNPEPKPWGRLGWALVGCPSLWRYVDLSVAPRAGEAVPILHWVERPAV